MSQKIKNPLLPRTKTPQRIRPSVKKEAIHPADYNRYKLPFACEDCSHFSSTNELCTLGLPTEPHLRLNQQHSYELSGKMALCRFHEID